MDEIENVKIDIGGNISMNQEFKERQKTNTDSENCRADPAVNGAVEFEISANQSTVVIGNWLVQRAHHCGAEAEFRKHQNAENGTEKAIQTEIFRAEQPKKQCSVEKREQQTNAAVNGICHHITPGVSGEIQFYWSAEERTISVRPLRAATVARSPAERT